MHARPSPLFSVAGPVRPAWRVLGWTVGALLVLLGAPALAQDADAEPRYTLMLRGVPANEALEVLVEETGLSLLYESGLVPEAPVYCAMHDQPAETMLRCIVDATGIDFYRLSSGTYVLTERVATATRYGALAGEVVDADTGAPLPYATVLLADASTGTAADADGRFAMASLVAGPYLMAASYVGYEAVQDSVIVEPGSRTRRRIALRRTTAQAAPVVVNGLQQRLPSTLLGRGEVALSDASDAPLDEDPLTQTTSVLGVTQSPAFADLHIQGGEAGEHQILLDGIPVFRPVALGRMLGAFSPLALGRLTVQKAGFGAAHGSYTAGVIQAEHSLGTNAAPGLDGALLTDQLSTSARLDAPVRIGNVTGRAMVAARTSLWDLFRDPMLDTTLRDWNVIDPVFTRELLGGVAPVSGYEAHRHGSDLSFGDLHAAGRFRLSPFTTLHATGYVGQSEIGTELFAGTFAGQTTGDDALLMLTRDRYRWTNAGGRLRATTLLGARAALDLGLRVSTHDLHHAYAMGAATLPEVDDVPTAEARLRDQLDAADTADDANRVSEWAAEARATYSLAPAHLLEGGLEAARVDHRFELGGGNGLGLAPLWVADTQWRLAGFATHRWTLGVRTVIEPGVRVTYIPDRQTAYAEPRLSIRHDFARGPITAVRLAGGLYRQFVGQYDLSNLGPSALAPSVRFWLPVGRGIAPPRTYQTALDLLITPHPSWTLQAESYAKWQPLLHALDYDALMQHSGEGTSPTSMSQADLLEEGEGYAYGVAVRLTHAHTRGTTSVSYGYDVAQRRLPSRFDGRFVQVPWNEPHRITARVDFRVAGPWQTHGRWRTVLGRAWGYRQAYYDFFEDEPLGTFQFDNPSDDTVPALHELDLGLSFTHAFEGALLGSPTVAARIDLLNVLDRANVLDWSLQGENGSGTSAASSYVPLTRYLPGRSLRLSLQLRL
ncbi:MAG: carboxypeptidase-like regulatory domain-containing protein [Bacteroidota bacterium]